MKTLSTIIEEFDKYISLADNEQVLKKMDTPEKLRDYIKSFISQSLRELLEQVVLDLEAHICRFNDYPQRCDCFKSASNQIKEIIKEILK